MQYVLTSQEMKTYDKNTIEQIGIPSLVLMERAALATVECMNEFMPYAKTVLIMAGTGNNGGDGLAIGRLLAFQGLTVDFLLVGEPEKMSEETKVQMKILHNLKFPLQSNFEAKEYDIVVDALFGIGLSREVAGIYKEAIDNINNLKQKGATVCAVDIPSGICADNGQVLGTAVYADLTATFAFAKRGHLLYAGKEHIGRLFVKDIGITEHSFGQQAPTAFTYEAEDIPRLLPKRKADGNKGTFGKVLLLAGGQDMSGACILCGEAILRTGAGMLKIITPECNREIMQERLPEAMLYSYTEGFCEEKVMAALEWADVVVAGPGMGTDEIPYHLLRCVLQQAELPLVLDADGLNLIAMHRELFVLAGQRERLIITPHPGELLRLLKTDKDTYRKQRSRLLHSLARQLHCIVVGKDAATMVVAYDTEQVYINTSGNDGMATAGSGDVLAGIIGGLLAQGTNEFQAASLGVYIHGLAGMSASKRKGRYGMIASDLIEELPLLME